MLVPQNRARKKKTAGNTSLCRTTGDFIVDRGAEDHLSGHDEQIHTSAASEISIDNCLPGPVCTTNLFQALQFLYILALLYLS